MIRESSSTKRSGLADLRKLARRLLVFCLPFVIYGLAILVIDPYRFFHTGGPVPFELKERIANPLNYAMWKLLEYRRSPAPNILLGDSRMAAMKEDVVEEMSGRDFSNLAYGGGSLEEAIRTFWFADGLIPLERVYLGVNFNNYNAADAKDRVTEVTGILANPLLYFSNYNVMSAAARIVWSLLTGRRPRIGRPDMNRDAFWRHQIDTVTRIFYTGYRYPEEYHRRLTEIADYCREHDIELAFVVFPSHQELQAQVARYGLETQYERFKADLEGMATVYDFDWPNAMTADRANYSDPYHSNREFARLIAREVWQDHGGPWVHVLPWKGAGHEDPRPEAR